MIAGLPFAFGAPAILFGLLALPVIWWLLRLTPPRPQAEPFAPLAILARVLKPEETPARSPWWLTALRLLIAALVILALAEPVLNPRDRALSANGPLALDHRQWLGKCTRLGCAGGGCTDADQRGRGPGYSGGDRFHRQPPP
jgi:hypothetical protein